MQRITMETLTKKKWLVMLTCITIIALFLRLYKLDYQPMWLDEGATYFFVDRPFSELFLLAEQTPPLFYMIEHVMFTLFGKNEIAFRIVPAIAGALTIPLICYLGKTVFDERIGLLAALFLAISPFHIWYCQVARSYSLALLFFVLTLIFVIKAMDSNDRKPWIISGIMASLSLYFHFYSVIYLGIVGIYLVYERSIRKKIPIFRDNAIRMGLTSFILLSIPVICLGIIRVKSVSAGGAFWDRGIDLVYSFYYNAFYSNDICLIVCLVLYFLSICLYVNSEKNGDNKVRLLLFFSIVPLMVFAVLSYRFGMNARYLMFVMPVLYVLVVSFFFFVKKPIKQCAIVAFILMIIVCATPMLFDHYTEYDRADFRTAGYSLYDMTEDGDCVVYLPKAEDTMKGPLSFYYDNEKDHTTLRTIQDVSDLNELIDSHEYSNIFFVASFQNGWGVDIYLEFLNGDCENVLNAHLISIYKYTC